MPYIKQSERDEIQNCIDLTAAGMILDNPGKLNYAITCLAQRYVAACGESYRAYNDIIGVLECAKLEIYRTQVGPYEQGKAVQNGGLTILSVKQL